MNTKPLGKWIIVLFLLAALPLVTAVMAQGDAPASETPVVVEPAAPEAGTTRVSVSSAGAQSNNHSENPDISSDGHFVIFESLAGNLVAGDTNKKTDVFVRSLEWDDEPEPPTGINLLAIGDSITFGYQHLSMQYPLGDPNLDGSVNAQDIAIYDGWLANPNTIPGNTTPAFKRGDADLNGNITANDRSLAQTMMGGTVPRAYFGTVVSSKTPASYRLPLYQMFSRQSAHAVTFVGTVDTAAEKDHNSFSGYPSGAGYPTPTAAQIAFVGQSGKTAVEVNTSGNVLFGIAPALNAITQKPDVALIHLGTNDLNQVATVTRAQTSAALSGIVDKLQGATGNANVKIYVALIIPDAYPGGACKDNKTFAAHCTSFDGGEVAAFNSSGSGGGERDGSEQTALSRRRPALGRGEVAGATGATGATGLLNNAGRGRLGRGFGRL